MKKQFVISDQSSVDPTDEESRRQKSGLSKVEGAVGRKRGENEPV
jgi:hypothetical protein